jgi:hypothetical protein
MKEIAQGYSGRQKAKMPAGSEMAKYWVSRII